MVDLHSTARYHIETNKNKESGLVRFQAHMFHSVTHFVLILTPVGMFGSAFADASVFLDLLFFNLPPIWELNAQFRAHTFSSSRQRKQDWHWGTWGPWTPVQDRFLTVLLILLERTIVTAWKVKPGSSEVKIEHRAMFSDVDGMDICL